MNLPYHKYSPLAGKLVRFGIVGIFVTAGYAFGTYAGITWLGLATLAASFLGCALCIIISYVGQKYFTFRSDGSHQLELPKFLMTCMIAVIASSVSISATESAGLDYRLGILITALVIPLCNFTIMNLWVFGQKSQTPK